MGIAAYRKSEKKKAKKATSERNKRNNAGRIGAAFPNGNHTCIDCIFLAADPCMGRDSICAVQPTPADAHGRGFVGHFMWRGHETVRSVFVFLARRSVRHFHRTWEEPNFALAMSTTSEIEMLKREQDGDERGPAAKRVEERVDEGTTTSVAGRYVTGFKLHTITFR